MKRFKAYIKEVLDDKYVIIMPINSCEYILCEYLEGYADWKLYLIELMYSKFIQKLRIEYQKKYKSHSSDNNNGDISLTQKDELG